MKKRNPYRVTADLINRFRGLWAEAGRSNIGKQYTPAATNLVSHKIGQLDSRAGQTLGNAFSDGIQEADRLTTVRFISAASDLYVDAIDPVTFYGIKQFVPPSEWNPPPWTPEPPPEEPPPPCGTVPNDPCVWTCVDVWDMLQTPVGEQKAAGVYPDCFQVSPWECEDIWEVNNTPSELRKEGVYPDCFTILPPPPIEPKTCSALWPLVPSLSDYEVAGAADDLITESTDSCWAMTCADLWGIYTDYSAYEIPEAETYEMIETGGLYTMASCWDTTPNCEQMYAQHPEWDDSRATGAVFPDCWEFVTDPPPQPTCEEYWALAQVDESLQKENGIYPDCISIDPFIPPPKGSCKSRLFSFPTYSDTITWNLIEGYSSEDTNTSYTFQVDAHMYSSEIGRALDYKIMGTDGSTHVIPDGNWFFSYSNINPPCRRLVTYGQNLQVVENLKEGTYSGYITFELSFGDFRKLPFTVELEINVAAGMDWEKLYNTYNQRRQMVGDAALPAYETFDFEDYDTQVSFINAAQTWCQGIQKKPWFSFDGFLISDEQPTLEAELKDGIWRDWEDNMKTTLNLGNGWLRIKNELPEGYGKIQTGDDVGIHLFQDLGYIFGILNILLQENQEDNVTTSSDVWEAGTGWKYGTSTFSDPFSPAWCDYKGGTPKTWWVQWTSAHPALTPANWHVVPTNGALYLGSGYWDNLTVCPKNFSFTAITGDEEAGIRWIRDGFTGLPLNADTRTFISREYDTFCDHYWLYLATYSDEELEQVF